MKKSLRTFGVLAVATVSMMTLASCQKTVGESSISTRSNGPRATMGAVNNTAATQASLKGYIYTDASYQSAFQQAVVGFLSTDVREDYVGTVSATGANGSGVRFGGRVALSNGSLRTMTGGYNTISPSSNFIIQVTDYVQQYQNAPPLPPFTFSQASGTISGTNVQITFADTYGLVSLNGTLNTTSNVFSGTISYDNNIKLDGTRPGAAGTLGNFQIAICDFFVCN